MNKEKIETEAINWFSCNKEGFSPKQKIDFEKWLNQNTNHKKAYENLNKLESICNSLNKSYIETLVEEVQKETKKTKFIEKTKSYSIAASFLILLFFSIFQGYNYYFEPTFTNTIITKTEPIEKYTLPDGSTLAIDAKTKLDIKFFKKEKEVNLFYGQALFSVKKDKNRPFNIISGNTHIQVVGTCFEVKRLNNQTTIKVKEGIVRVSKINLDSKKLQTLTLLKKGQQIDLDKFSKVLKISSIQIKNIALWKNNQIVFDNTSLKEALIEFSKYTNIQFNIKNKDIENILITGQFSTTQLENFFSALKSIYPIKIEKNDQTINVSKIN